MPGHSIKQRAQWKTVELVQITQRNKCTYKFAENCPYGDKYCMFKLVQVQYLDLKYKYEFKYFKTVLEYNSSTSTKYQILHLWCLMSAYKYRYSRPRYTISCWWRCFAIERLEDRVWATNCRQQKELAETVVIAARPRRRYRQGNLYEVIGIAVFLIRSTVGWAAWRQAVSSQERRDSTDRHKTPH